MSNKLVHYSRQSGLKTLDPEFMGTGAPSEELKQGPVQTKQTSFYREGVEPESVVASGAKSKYTVNLGPEHKLYDIYEDPQGLVAQSVKQTGGINTDHIRGTLKNAGYHGFYTTHPNYKNQGVVNLLHPMPVSGEEEFGKAEELNKNYPISSKLKTRNKGYNAQDMGKPEWLPLEYIKDTEVHERGNPWFDDSHYLGTHEAIWVTHKPSDAKRYGSRVYEINLEGAKPVVHDGDGGYLYVRPKKEGALYPKNFSAESNPINVKKADLQKSPYGPKGAGLYSVTDNARRKMDRTSEDIGWGPNRAIHSTKPTASQQASVEAREYKQKSKKNPVKIYSPEEIKAFEQSRLAASEDLQKEFITIKSEEPLMKPYHSEAQRRWAHTAAGTKALGGKKAVKEWDTASRGLDLPEIMEKGLKGDWQKEGYKINHKGSLQGGDLEILAHDKAGNKVGYSQIDREPNGTIYNSWIHIGEDHRRKGIASGMLSYAENLTGRKLSQASLVEDTGFSPEGKALWTQPNRPFGKSDKLSQTLTRGSARSSLMMSQKDTIKSNLQRNNNFSSQGLNKSSKNSRINTVTEEDLMKGRLLRDSIIGNAVMLGLAVNDSIPNKTPTAQAPAAQYQAQQPTKKKGSTDNFKEKMLRTISSVESTGGTDYNHKKVESGLNAGHTAAGEYGLMPLTTKDIVGMHPHLNQKYGHLLDMSPDQVKQELEKSPNMQREIAGAHVKRLAKIFGNDPAKIGYAWINGVQGTMRAIKNNVNIEDHWHTKKILREFYKK